MLNLDFGLKVNNKKAIRNLALKSYKNNRARNRIAISAIMLTSVLFTIIFTLGMGAVKSMEYNAMRMSGGMAHGSFKYLSEEQYENLKNHPLIERIGRTYIVGTTCNEELLKRSVEVDYLDDTAADMRFIKLKEGGFAKESNEIVVDTVTLDLLSVPHEIGSVVQLSINFGDRIESYDFVLSGYYEGDFGITTSYALVSEAFVKQELSGRGQQYYKDFDMRGSINADVMFQNDRTIQENMETVIIDSGYVSEDGSQTAGPDTIWYGVNWAYLNASMNQSGLIGAIVIVCCSLLIVFTGYLIIYNIFQISVIRDIRFYGLLITVGTTGRQIRSILLSQALLMCKIGIPCGLFIGYALGRMLLPLIMVTTYGGQTYASTSPIIFLGSAAFALVTVWMSIRKPAKTAAKISPAEAVKYSGVGQSYFKKRKFSSNGSKLYRMAFSNLGRNWKRTVIAVISMTLSLVLMNTVLTLSKSFDMDAFVARFVDVDFQISHASYFNYDYRGTGEDGVSDSIIAAVESQDGFLDGGGIYTFTNSPESTSYQIVQAEYMGSLVNPWNQRVYDYDERNGLRTCVYGMEDFCLLNLDIVQGELDLDKIKSGKAVLLGLMDDDYGNVDFSRALYSIGETVKLKVVTDVQLDSYLYNAEGEPIDVVNKYTYGEMREYEVIGYYRMSYGNSKRSYGDDATIAMAAGEMQTFFEGNLSRMTYLCEGKEETGITQMETFLSQYTREEEVLMAYSSRASYEKEFAQLQVMLLGIGGVLCGIIGMIGILNFMNSISTGIITRQQEFAMLKSIGMTEGQLIRMLVLEGIYYALMTMGISLLCSLIFSYGILSHMGEILWLLTFKATFVSLFIAYPLLLLFAAVLPYIIHRNAAGHSIVEQLKIAE